LTGITEYAILALSIGLPLDITHLFSTMDQGTIARLTDRGFGFIKRDGQEKDLFFHSKELVGITFEELREGDKVSFEVAESPKGPNAIKVSKI
jgi:CspA family cold shock protein